MYDNSLQICYNKDDLTFSLPCNTSVPVEFHFHFNFLNVVLNA